MVKETQGGDSGSRERSRTQTVYGKLMQIQKLEVENYSPLSRAINWSTENSATVLQWSKRLREQGTTVAASGEQNRTQTLLPADTLL